MTDSLPKGSDTGPVDDAIHIENPIQRGVTLCKQPTYRVLNVIRHGEEMPDVHAGCWTCMSISGRMSRGLAAWMKGR